MKLAGINCSEKEIQDLIKEADTDRDGKISYEEYKKMMSIW